MTIPHIQTSSVSGEISPSVWGRIDKAEFRNGASTLRNFFVGYRGGAVSRAGFAYVGMCKQGAPNLGSSGSISIPPRDINFQVSINQGFALEFGQLYMRVKSDGEYVTESANAITAITNAEPGVFTYTNTHYTLSNGDWIFIQSVGGMTNFNGLTWIVQNVSGATFTVTDLFGDAIDTTGFSAYTSGGTLERIYTAVSPYAAVDLPYLKFTQTATVMNLTCVNQETDTEYPSYTLTRVSDASWTFAQVSFGTTAVPPTGVSVTAKPSTSLNTWYGYRVTSINSTGDESTPSSAAYVQNNNISVNAGSNIITWNAVSSGGGATSYNVYATTPVYGSTNVIPIGADFSFLGSSFGTQFIDTNIVSDATDSPPIHSNPFARGQITDVIRTAGGSSYSQAGITYSIGTTAGVGFVGTPIVVSGAFSGFYIENNGSGYKTGDTMVISGDGTGATATLSVGPQTGTYPGVCQYFQQRLVYADTLNNPDTYYMSHPGAYSTFDSSIPSNDGDAIIGTPWGVQINGIQFMVPTLSGLLTFTGNGVWLINGGSSAAITPSDQNAQAQAQIGCSALVPPLYLNLHILYVQAKNSIVRDIAFNFLYNVFQGTDITVFSNHLFSGFTLIQWAYAEEPYKVVWAVRDDGTMLSLTYIKEQEVQGWARHDTNGVFVSVCSVIEPPVDAIYTIVKRYIVGEAQWAYYSERADNRLWENAEDCFCVDAGLTYPMIFPAAILTPAALDGDDNISAANLIVGGSGYTSPTLQAVDPSGQGNGFVATVQLSGGIITGATITNQGSDYQPGTYFNILDSTGTGAVIQPIITNYVTFTASAGVFTLANVGNVIRVDGGKATIVTYNSSTSVVANITQPLTAAIPDDPNNLPVQAASGDWSLSTPTTTVSGLNHLEGMLVSILADGGVQAQQTVASGSITLQETASAITIGLPFTAQYQSLYLEPPSQMTTQGRRKDIQSVTVRFEQSRGMTVGTNQPDQSVQMNNAIIPWTDMKEVKERNALIAAGTALPLYSGDYYVLVPGDWSTKGQVAIQQENPLPCTILAFITNFTLGDPPG